MSLLQSMKMWINDIFLQRLNHKNVVNIFFVRKKQRHSAYLLRHGKKNVLRKGAKLTGRIPVIGLGLAVVTGFVGGMVGYFGGLKLGDTIYSAGKKVAGAAKTVAKAAWNGIKSAGRAIGNGIKSAGRAIVSFFGF